MNLIVALDGIDERLISHNLGVSTEEGLETLLDCLQLLFIDLEERTDKRGLSILYSTTHETHQRLTTSANNTNHSYGSASHSASHQNRGELALKTQT